MTQQAATGSTSVKTLAEIESQPDMWRQAIALAATAPGLPAAGERVLVLGCGTSYYVGLAYAAIREDAGLGATDVHIGSEIPRVFRPYDRVMAISRSGTSSELLDAVRAIQAQQPGIPVTALLGEQGTPLGDLATDIVDLSFADEESVVQTRFPSTQLAMLRAAMAVQESAAGAAAYDRSPLVGIGELPALGDQALTTDIPATGTRQLVVLATGWGRHVAEEAALKVRESSGTWVESYPVGEYRHGPVATCGEGSLVWGLDRIPDDIIEVVESAGGRVEHGCGEPLAELVRIHRYAVQVATEAGRDADHPHLLSRSVILPNDSGA